MTSGASSVNYGIYGSAPNTGNNRAGFFNGKIEATEFVLTISDQQFKTNITDIPSALDIVKQLKPHTYYMDTSNYTAFNFDSRKQFGFIAQELESVLPEVVHSGFNPGTLDSTGMSLGDSINYKSVNYSAIIPINTQAIKELNTKFIKQTLSDQSIKTNVNNLTGSLEKVLAMRGVSFNWNQNLLPEYELDNTEHVGFIAQEINAVDPRLTFISDENLMHVDYNKIVPIAVEAIQELNSQIAQRDSVINSLNDRLTHLESCLSGILPFLCQISHNSIQPTQQEFQQQLKKEIDVQLSNRGTIILNQNV
ncbi:MAG: tail fiber domain-containing protein, partial [Crocinitomicaceae bacterium]|nr:tail fiber domain-containing protein [Crocinitomicaceae bacterium]